MNDNMETIKSLIGKPCLCIEVRSDKIFAMAPTSKMIMFSEYEVWQMQEDPECPSDYGIEVSVEEHEDQIVVSMTDGMCEARNYIYIFTK